MTTGADNRTADFDIVLVGQRGRLQYEALLLVASLRAMAPDFSGTVYVAEPQPGPLWPDDPTMSGEIRAALTAQGATILPFEATAFGQTYPMATRSRRYAPCQRADPSCFSTATR